MKILFTILIFIVLTPSFSMAQSKGQTNRSATKNLSTDIQFDFSNIYGRYNTADEAIATVEDEKIMGRLLGLRMDFKDRLQKQVQQK